MKETRKGKKTHRSKHERKTAKQSRSKESAPNLEHPRSLESEVAAEAIEEAHIDDIEIVKELPKRYHPIRVFADDRAALLEQLFESVRGSDLQDMIPDTLKTFKFSELKKMCWKHLEKMPKDLILHILSGNDPDLYSEEKVHDTVTSSEQELSESSKSETCTKRKVDDIDDLVSSTTDNICPSKRKYGVDTIEEQQENVSTGVDPTKTDPEPIAVQLQEGLPPLENLQEPVGELFELEMRARAIRSFLKAKGYSSSEDSEAEPGDDKSKNETEKS